MEPFPFFFFNVPVLLNLAPEPVLLLDHAADLCDGLLLALLRLLKHGVVDPISIGFVNFLAWSDPE